MVPDEIAVVNAFFGFCTPMGGTWPDPLARLGYNIIGIEYEITTQLNGQDRRIVPDIACASGSTAHTLLVDAKSKTIDVDQEHAYEQIESTLLHAQGVADPSVSASDLTHDVVLVSYTPNSPHLIMALEVAEINLPVIKIDELICHCESGEIRQIDVAQVFANGVGLAGYEWPRGFMQFNHDSTVEDMASKVIASLAYFIIQGGQFSTYAVMTRCIEHWDLIGRTEQRRLREKIVSIMSRASELELHSDFKKAGSADQWEALGNRPFQSNQLEALSQRVRDCVGHFTRQPSLFYKQES